jgi:hypothetical protein
MENNPGKDKKKRDHVKKYNDVKTIGIFTKNFRLYHDLVSNLKKRNISYVSLSSLKHTPNKIGVIITSNQEIHDIKSSKVIAADAYDSIDSAVDKAMHMLIGKELYSKIYIGVDPGDKPGIAIVGDNILLKKIQVRSPEIVIQKIKGYIDEYPAMEYLIRIGHGSIITRNRIINSLIPLKISIEIVDESKTSSSQQQIKRDLKDGEAAAAIALLKGGKVQRRLPLKPTRGDIKRIQEKSREITEGRLSISEKSALEVLKGKISLSEAIDFEISLRKNKP